MSIHRASCILNMYVRKPSPYLNSKNHFERPITLMLRSCVHTYVFTYVHTYMLLSCHPCVPFPLHVAPRQGALVVVASTVVASWLDQEVYPPTLDRALLEGGGAGGGEEWEEWEEQDRGRQRQTQADKTPDQTIPDQTGRQECRKSGRQKHREGQREPDRDRDKDRDTQRQRQRQRAR